jgi:hypothetical protein
MAGLLLVSNCGHFKGTNWISASKELTGFVDKQQFSKRVRMKLQIQK